MSIFDLAVVAQPCRWPCQKHVHDEDLEPNRGARNDMDPENNNVFFPSSTQYEVE